MEDSALGSLFLTGFELAREEKQGIFSSMSATVDWEQRLYTHSSRHEAGTLYTMAHDIYSLGVNLLEIGLWQSFISYDPSVQSSNFDDDALPGGRKICGDLRKGVAGAGSG